jgi:hypothetical protein
LYLLSKGYTCRFKSEAFASFASIALRPWLRVYRIGKFLLKLRPMEKTIDLTQIIITLYYCNLHELLSSTPCYLTGENQTHNITNDEHNYMSSYSERGDFGKR